MLERLDQATAEPGWQPTLADLQSIVMALGASVDQGRPAAVALNAMAHAIIDQARNVAPIPTPPVEPVEGAKDSTPIAMLLVLDLAGRAFSATAGDPEGRRRLEEALRRAGVSEARLREYRRNLQRTAGRARAERGAIRRQEASPFPPGVDSPEQRREWLLETVARLAVTLSAR